MLLRIALPALLLALASSSTLAACPALLDHEHRRLASDETEHLCQYTGQVLLVVNTASRCGFTGQFAELEALFGGGGKGER